MPSAFALSRVRGMDAVELRTTDGARATVLLHGGHLLSWVPAGADEQLFVSEKSAFAPERPVRGGVPVVFPQFAARGPLTQHGFARVKPWQLVMAEQGHDDATAVMRLTDDANTRLLWPHAFALELKVHICGKALTLTLSCLNRGAAPFDFACALHTYLRLDDLRHCSVQGLNGLRYWDSVELLEKADSDDVLMPEGNIDRIYRGLGQALLFCERQGPSDRKLEIRQHGFKDAVIWNPGAQKCAAMADMQAGEQEHMLCIEAANIFQRIQLEAGASWSGSQTLTLL